MIKALIWKEWQQLRWKLIFSLIIVAAFMAIGLRTRIVQDDGIFVICIVGVSILMPIFVTMGLFAEEAEEGTLTLQLRLPVDAQKVYWVKMAAGTIVAVCPLLLSLILALVLSGGREVGAGHILRMYGPTFLFIVVFVIWITTLSMNVDSEFKAVLIAIGIFFVWGLFCILDDSFGWGGMSMVLTPIGLFEAGFEYKLGPSVILIQSGIGMFLFHMGRLRFEKLAGRSK